MKAAVFKTHGASLVIEDVPDPEPGPHDLVLKVKACGICGTDLHWSEHTVEDVGWRVLDPNTIMGHEFAGEVVEVGKEARGDWRVGDRVCAQPWIGCGTCDACRAGRGYLCSSISLRASADVSGAYAEFTRIGSTETLRLPDSVSFQEGAMVEPLAVGLNSVRRAGLVSGDTVLIVGAGPVGLSVALWCRFFGARHVIVSDLVAARAEGAAAMGATAAIDASTEDVTAAVERIAGSGPRVVFDCVGVRGSLQHSIDLAPHDARIMVVGLCMAQDHIFPAKALTKELDIGFVFVYHRADFDMVVDMLGQGRIDALSMVTSSVGFDAFPDAFDDLKAGPTDQIKVMLEPD
jgi:(R,R)-butanediol dehydrogenase/meso-butanediol dehydrogenase/diacetyl reductase